MSAPPFKLSKRGKTWHATGGVGKARAFDIDCGDGSEASARKIAEREVGRRAQLQEASRIRWRRFHAAKRAAPAATDPELPDDIEEQIEEQESEETEEDQTPIDRPAPPPAPPRDNEAIRAKLLALGDAVQPDAVIPPDQGDDKPDDDPVDDETGQLLGDVLGGVLVTCHTRRITRSLKNKKPPQRPGEPDDRMLAWEHEGIAFNLKKLLGKAVAMGPTGKMLAGFGIVTAQMYLDAETIGGEAKAAAAPEPAPAPAEEPRGNVNGTPTNQANGSLSLVPKPNPLGKF